MMYPLVRPGSLVQIDDSRTQIRQTGWTNEFERPIYFFELPGHGYAFISDGFGSVPTLARGYLGLLLELNGETGVRGVPEALDQ